MRWYALLPAILLLVVPSAAQDPPQAEILWEFETGG